jgi:hypothetical protein
LVRELRRYIAEHGCAPPSKAAFARWVGASVDTIDRALRRPGRFGQSSGSFAWAEVLDYALQGDGEGAAKTR